MELHEIPKQEFAKMRSELLQQIQSMDDAELAIVTQTRESLGYFIANAFQAIAKALGYMIAVPIAWGMRIAESMAKGFQDGFDKAFQDAGY